MDNKKCIAMLLAGGEGKRLAPFTSKRAKPAIAFAGKYKIIDFSLSNCSNSGFTTVGVLTQFHPLVLNEHLGNGEPWDLDRRHGGLTLLPPHLKQGDDNWYKGTANAIFQNMDYIEQYNPEYLLIISADHVYKMDYSLLLDFHIKHEAAGTVAVREVAWEEASRFGVMSVDGDQVITKFEEKPDVAQSNLASMGIYIFNWKDLKQHLCEDELNANSTNDFGQDVIPKMLGEGAKLVAYPFHGYWRDVGTIQSYWETTMDLLSGNSLDLYDETWPIYTVNHDRGPTFVEKEAYVSASMFGDGAQIGGKIKKSMIFSNASVGSNSYIEESIVMPGARIGCHVHLYRAIVGERAVIEDNVSLGNREDTRLSIVDHEQVVFSDE